MKKLFLSSLVLLFFSFSILIFQISCRKDAVAQNATTAINKMVYSVYDPTLGQVKIFTSNLDGSNAVQVPVGLPGWTYGQVKFSPDGTKLFFLGDSSAINGTRVVEIFSANLDGSNFQRITNHSTLGGQYVAFLDDVK